MTVGKAIWSDQLDDAERARLRPGVPAEIDRSPEVLVVGGGIVGCAAAAACLQAGYGSVVLLEREALGAGASGGAAGLLQPEAHVGVDPPEFVDFMRRSLAAWHDLEASWPGGVGLLPKDWKGQAQARVNPLRAIARLAAGLPNVATGVDVSGVSASQGAVRTVHTSIGDFLPERVVFATGLPPRFGGLENLPASEVKGHMLCSAPTGLRRPDELADLVTVIEDGRLLMGGTLDVDDHERVVRPEVTDRMWAELVGAWPEATAAQMEYRWACFRPAHPDRLPVIDRIPGVDNAWLTSGHYKTGILLAPGTGRALAEWMASGSPPPGVEPFSQARLVRVASSGVAPASAPTSA
jgi:glycine/D-amino acid oxidase-like deaminating enzyme